MNIVIAQGGGPTAVINQSLVGVMERLRAGKSPRSPLDADSRIFGARHGVKGMLTDEFIDLTETPSDLLERVARTPSAALGSTRDKPDEAYCAKILESLRKRRIGCLFYIGGNDSSDTCRIVRDMAKKAGDDLVAFHVPKTIDNDLVCNDHTPGYGSAARWVATTFMSDDLDNRSLPGIKINVVMGRNAGFLTAASTLGRRDESDGPHLIYVPERTFDLERFIGDVDRVYTKRGRCLIAVSEGVRGGDGKPITEAMGASKEKDSHGNVQLSGTGALGDFLAATIKKGLEGAHRKLRVRADTFGYIQRSSFEVSPVDAREAREVGRHAATRLLEGDRREGGGSITITRASGSEYRAQYGLVPLEDVAAKTRTMPEEFIAAHEPDVPDAFRRYALPLVGELPAVARVM